MNTACASIHVAALRRSLPIALAIGALVTLDARANTAAPEEIIVSGPTVTTIDHNMPMFGAPMKQVTASARVEVDPRTLTTADGVAQLNTSVLHAARKACAAADPLARVDQVCIRGAVKSAQPQVAALVAQARSVANG